ncbi:hypothetical protein H0X48_03500 [Candidatus Dependentiae bacterium]|nr:hypothetical protein [Candidatus Dependentiae bacterium]
MRYYFFLITIYSIMLTNVYSSNSQSFLLGAWLPYWKCKEALSVASAHSTLFEQLSPFSYELNKQGKIIDTFKKNANVWQNFFRECHLKKIKIIPTIFSTNTQLLHNLLFNSRTRLKHINELVSLVVDNKFDGININYERIKSEDRNSFISFMKTLSQKLHSYNKLLCCCVGGRVSDSSTGLFINKHLNRKPSAARAPSVSLHPGKGIQARNYKKALAQCCDQIHLMGYDEWGTPYQYNPDYLKSGYYISHASTQWLKAIIQYALSYIPAHKLVLGIGSYGLEFSIKPETVMSHFYFKKIRNISYPQAQSLSQNYTVIPKRTAGGELAFTYKLGNETRYVCFIDAQAIASRIALAKKYGLKGAYIFKLDGLEDNTLWPLLANKN